MAISKAIWDSLLDADLNVRYWREMSGFYFKLDRRVKIFLAIMTSGTVASWQIWSSCPVLWKVLSGIAALTAIASPLLGYDERIKRTSVLVGQWVEVRDEYDVLFSTMKNRTQSELATEFKRIKYKETDVSKKEGDLPVKERLRDRCYREVLRSWGLDKKGRLSNGRA
jgi:hypothetical protein